MPRLAPVTRTALSAMFMAVTPVLPCSCGFRAACFAAYRYRPARFPGIAASGCLDYALRDPAADGDELVAGGGSTGQPDRVGEEPGPGARRDEERGDRQQDGRQARRDRPA